MNNLKWALKSTHVARWHIVHATKYQSIAEHQYGAWLITAAIWDTLFPVPHNSFDREAALLLALTHDLPEIQAGDVPSSASDYLSGSEDSQTRALKSAVEDRVMHIMGYVMPSVHKGTLPGAVVKIADKVEAAYFALNYIPDPEILRHGKVRLAEAMAEAVALFPQERWPEVSVKVIQPLVWPL